MQQGKDLKDSNEYITPSKKKYQSQKKASICAIDASAENKLVIFRIPHPRLLLKFCAMLKWVLWKKNTPKG